MHIKKQQESCGKLKSLPMLELRLLFGFANVTTGKNNFSCKQKGDCVMMILVLQEKKSRKLSNKRRPGNFQRQ